MEIGRAAPDAKHSELSCGFGSPTNGSSNPFLDHAEKALEFPIKVSLNVRGTWSYEQDTVLKIVGSDQLFHHTDRNTLYRIAEPTPNWLMRQSGLAG